MHETEAHVTRVYERHGCFFVEGVFKDASGYRPAAFTIPKQEIIHKSRDEFMEFARRNLPLAPADKDWTVGQ